MRPGLAARLAIAAAIPLTLAACVGDRPVAERPEFPQRIVSLSPSVTEILHGLGVFDRVVAVSDYCVFPPEAAALPRVGGWTNTSLERVAALKPDLVVMIEPQAAFVQERLEALGIAVLHVPSRSMADVYTAIASIGGRIGVPERAAALIAETRTALDAVRERTRELPRRRVLCVVDRVPGTLKDMYVATGDSFLAALVEIAGGDSIAPPHGLGYGQVSKETVMALDPEVIIDMVQGSQGALGEDRESVWRDLPELTAVQTGRIHPVLEVSVLHPSQFVADTARRFAEIIHPEAFDSVRR